MKPRTLTTILTTLGAVAGILLATAGWSAGEGAGGAYIRNGSATSGGVKIPMPDYKTAERTASQLNKEEDKAEKRKEKEEKKSGRSK